MVKNVSSSTAVVLALLVVVLLGGARLSEAMTCNTAELQNACAGAISSSRKPSTMCCSKLREQVPCLCGYLKNPNLRKLLSSPGARRVANACGVSTPRC